MTENLVFVDGELYTGKIIFARYKGIGWKSGRPYSIILEKKLAARYQSVYYVDLKYNKLRNCKFVENGNLKSQLKSETTEWELIEMPSDLV